MRVRASVTIAVTVAAVVALAIGFGRRFARAVRDDRLRDQELDDDWAV